jgi:hypothetical protein
MLIPLWLAGAGSGHLFADSVPREPVALRRAGIITLVLALAWVTAMYAASPILIALSGSHMARTLVAMLVVSLTGASLGVPLAIGLQFLSTIPRGPAGWSWANHLAGWGLGGAVAATVVHFTGVRVLWLLGGAELLVALLFFAVGTRQPAELASP